MILNHTFQMNQAPYQLWNKEIRKQQCVYFLSAGIWIFRAQRGNLSHSIAYHKNIEQEKQRKYSKMLNMKALDSNFFLCCKKGAKNSKPSAHMRTMLQKLSKCEVKAWLCRNLLLLPPLRFFAKSNFGGFKQFTNVIFGHSRCSQFYS